MSLEVQGVLFLIAVVLFLVGGALAWVGHRGALAAVAVGLAFVTFVAMFNAFDAA